MKPNKRSSRLLALALSLVLSLSLSLPALAAGEDGIIYIHTAKDLCALSDSCAYDAWSRGKTVLLTADISLRGVDFEPIASFSGTFNGGGHTISGLTLTDSLSPPVFSSRSSAAPSSTRSRSRGRSRRAARRNLSAALPDAATARSRNARFSAL
ncbi:MAG: hypothetical protein ACLS6C_08245 [Clostridia bacterium]